MIMEISNDRYLPGPESFDDNEWQKVSDLARRVVISMKKVNADQLGIYSEKVLPFAIQCCGFNWSLFAWGKLRRKCPALNRAKLHKSRFLQSSA